MFHWTIAQKIASRYVKQASGLIPAEAKKRKKVSKSNYLSTKEYAVAMMTILKYLLVTFSHHSSKL
jgi:hypothetical protein